jgi:hypothetical protein
LSLPGCGVVPPSAATESLAAATWPRGRAVAGVDAGRVAVLAPPLAPLAADNWPSPLGKEPVAAIWLRAMSVQFRDWFRQWATSQSQEDQAEGAEDPKAGIPTDPRGSEYGTRR